MNETLEEIDKIIKIGNKKYKLIEGEEQEHHLENFTVGTRIKFHDGRVGVVVNNLGCAIEDSKSIVLTNFFDDDECFDMANGYFDKFKKGEYKIIGKGWK